MYERTFTLGFIKHNLGNISKSVKYCMKGPIIIVSVLMLFSGCRMAENQAPNLQSPTDLWQVYERSLKSAKYVDLTHAITPTIPVWKGFG